MIEIGTVTGQNAKQGAVTVSFDQLGTQAECVVLQSTTGANNTFILPSLGTQVVCWLESGKNIALGAVFSDEEPVPPDARADGFYYQAGGVVFAMKGGKVSLKNDAADLKTLLKDILTAIQNLTVSTPTGPSGTPLPPTVQAVQKTLGEIENLLY